MYIRYLNPRNTSAQCFKLQANVTVMLRKHKVKREVVEQVEGKANVCAGEKEIVCE